MSLAKTAAAVVLGTGVTAGVAASAADLLPNEDADAVLLALCARAEEEDRLMMAANDLQNALKQKGTRSPAFDAARNQCDNHFDAFVGLAEKAAVIPARTVAGMRAKARIVFLNMNTQMHSGELTWHILRDLGWEA